MLHGGGLTSAPADGGEVTAGTSAPNIKLLIGGEDGSLAVNQGVGNSGYLLIVENEDP